jgi:hypothetical protein
MFGGQTSMNTTYNNGSTARRSGSSMIRPAWTPVTIAMMIFGFVIFWPLGLAMIAYILWGDRFDDFKSEVNNRTDGFAKSWNCRGSHSQSSRTGNVAFDEWRDAEIDRLREERRQLDEMRAEFESHLNELRRAKDQKDFDAFMDAYKRNTAEPKNNTPKKKSVPDV